MTTKKVVVLGGGAAALTAAFELTRPERKGEYEVTVYQIGWRLGGKGASSRNEAIGDRIEEHGLHLWMGCYENAFRVMRECYEAYGRDWTEAFTPHTTTVLEEQYDGQWYHWPTTFPVFDTRPGENDDVADAPELSAAMMRWVWRLLTPADDDVPWGPPADAPAFSDPPALVLRPLELAARALAGVGPAHRIAAMWLRVARAAAWRWRGHRLDHTASRRALLTLDFLLTNLIGVLTEGFLVPRSGGDLTYADWLENIQRIDDEHYPDWLLRHGAQAMTAESCIVRGLGDAVFNSAHRGSAAAGLNGFVRLNLTFRGSVFFKMHAGMGETVFTPLYRVLAARGVKFEFFTRADRIHIDGAKNVTSIDLTRQVALQTAGTYEPLVQVGGLECWPRAPRVEQVASVIPVGIDLESPAPVPGETPFTLHAGTDFDAVVLGVSIGGLRPLTEELAAADPRWRAMLDSIQTTATQSVQLWLSATHRELGWEHGETVATAYEESLDTWADMTHLLGKEGWRAEDGVEACSYFVGSLTDSDDDATQAARVTREADAWFERNLPHLLPGMRDRGRIDPSKILSRYERANVRPSDRYVLSVPGSGRHRLPADASGFGRLFLAGDWTRTGMNVGCVEAAVMSGLRAARGITGDPVRIVGDFR